MLLWSLNLRDYVALFSIILKLQRVFKTTEFQKYFPSYLHVRLYIFRYSNYVPSFVATDCKDFDMDYNLRKLGQLF